MTKRSALWLMLASIAGIFYGVPCALMGIWLSAPLALATVFCSALVIGYSEVMHRGLFVGSHQCGACDMKTIRIAALEFQVNMLTDGELDKTEVLTEEP